MRIIKRIKWPGWIVLIFFFIGTIHHFINTRTETYDENINYLHQTANNQKTIQEEIQDTEEAVIQKEETEDQVKLTESKELDPSGKYVALTFDDGHIRMLRLVFYKH